MKEKIINESPVLMAEVKEQLEKFKEKGELSFRAQKTFDYLQQVVKLDSKKQQELKKKLEDLNVSRLRDVHLIKIINVMPKTEEELKVTLEGYNLTLTKEQLQKIVSVVQEFL